MHLDPGIDWVDDALPALARLGPAHFDFVLLTAVWMNPDAAERTAAMHRLAALLRPGGGVILSLRHGPVPPVRRMFAVTGDETAARAATQGLREIRRVIQAPVLVRNIAAGVCWTRHAFLCGA